MKIVVIIMLIITQQAYIQASEPHRASQESFSNRDQRIKNARKRIAQLAGEIVALSHREEKLCQAYITCAEKEQTLFAALMAVAKDKKVLDQKANAHAEEANFLDKQLELHKLNLTILLSQEATDAAPYTHADSGK